MANQRREPASNPLMYGGILPQEEMLAIGKKHKKLSIGIPREKQQIEQRVSLTPEAVEVLVGSGHEVILESQAGEGARYTNNDYSGTNTVNRQDDIFNIGLNMKYLVNRYLYVKTGYDYHSRSSNIANSNYDINNLYLSIGTQL